MLPNVLHDNGADHVPVLAEEVRDLLDVQPGETVVDATFGAGGHAAVLAAELRGPRPLHRHRPRPDACARTSSASSATPASRRASCAARPPSCSASWPTTTCEADAILLDLGVSSMQLDRPERGFTYAHDAPLDMRMDTNGEETAARHRQRRERARADAHLPRLRRGALRAPDRPRDRPPAQRAAVRAHRRARRDDQGAIPAPARFGEGHPAKRVFQALRIAVNDELGELEERAPGRRRHAAAGRAAGGDQLPLARGPHGQALHPRPRARLRLPARLPGLPRAARSRSCAS